MIRRFLPAILVLLSASIAFAQQPPKWGFPDEERTPQLTFAANELPDADWGAPFIKAPEAWSMNPAAKGKNIRIGIFDNGCDVKHPAFVGKIKGVYNATTKTLGVCDPGDHGTHVTGTVLHVAPEADIYIIQVLTGNSGGVDTIAHGLDYAVKNFNIDVANFSLGGGQADQWIPPAFARADAAGVILNVAAGNEGPAENTEGYPARYKEAISTAAHDKNRFVANFSSRGPSVFQCLPGVDITAPWPNGKQATIQGTSMAAPFGSGASASWCATHPEIPKIERPAKYREALRNALSRPTQRNNASGYGVLDMTKFTPLATTPTDPTKPVEPTPPAIITITFDDLTPAARARLDAAGVSSITLAVALKASPKVMPSTPMAHNLPTTLTPPFPAPAGKTWSLPPSGIWHLDFASGSQPCEWETTTAPPAIFPNLFPVFRSTPSTCPSGVCQTPPRR